ncbi:C2H2 finger domain-containing protein [Rutstroemia sp. NJR-2017a BBW]|nr:C2H2 finger domain-containing protein [Rutstroemia sp. NJR-2017a BBW]
MLFKARAFKSPSINSPEKLYSLDILDGLNEQALPLKEELDEDFVFCQAVREAHSVRIAHELKLSSDSVRYRMKKGGEITGFAQVTKPYVLRDGAAKALNESSDVSDSLQNLILQHSSIDTFLKHYLDRRINADLLKIHRGMKPEKELMSPKEENYHKACRRLRNEKQRQRRLLLVEIVDRFKKEQPVIESERQLLGKVVDEDTRGALERSGQMTPEQLLLIDAILTLPETTLEREYQRRIAAINAITAYCGVEEGTPYRHGPRGRPAKSTVPVITKAAKLAPSASDITLSNAILSIKTDKRPTKCFLCLGNPALPLQERVTSYATPGSLSRHFLRRHVKKLKESEQIECRICDIRLEHRDHLQNHAERFHGTVSRLKG